MAETIFGQLVVGPPGSGKSTYCKFICENLKQLGRNAKIINLDPANDSLPYKPAINIMDLITVEQVMEKSKCGPNGAMIHCIDILDRNYAWLYDQIAALLEDEKKKFDEIKKILEDEETNSDPEKKEHSEVQGADSARCRPYLLFDCPGQTELYTHHTAMRDLIGKLTRRGQHFDLRLVCMNLCDAYHASDLGKYIGLVMNSLSTMLNLALPHVNVLSKIDKMECYGKTRFNQDFYCEVMDLKYLLETELESPFFAKYRELSKKLVDVIEDYSLVSFIPLNIQQAEDIYRVLQMADRANGFLVDDLDLSILQMNPSLMELASGRRLDPLNDGTVQI